MKHVEEVIFCFGVETVMRDEVGVEMGLPPFEHSSKNW